MEDFPRFGEQNLVTKRKRILVRTYYDQRVQTPELSLIKRYPHMASIILAGSTEKAHVQRSCLSD